MWFYFLKNAFKTFLNTKNILKMFSAFLVVLFIRIFFKYIEVKIGWFESDFFFYISSFIGISASSFIKIFIDLFDIPDINWSLLKDFMISPLSEKFKTIRDLISLFNGLDKKFTIGGPLDNNNNLNHCGKDKKSLYLFMENKGETVSTSSSSKDVATNTNTFKGDQVKPIEIKQGPQAETLQGLRLDWDLLIDSLLDIKDKLKNIQRDSARIKALLCCYNELTLQGLKSEITKISIDELDSDDPKFKEFQYEISFIKNFLQCNYSNRIPANTSLRDIKEKIFDSYLKYYSDRIKQVESEFDTKVEQASKQS